ncbi:PEP-CTERM sorting domain-containing protein [Thalassomonas haliotis]|uniref:PEP-CTERM sorting domain-containing protein n=1 Tax=Thalassomonas haliotis TaxID=485448 RepID=A0ABY7VHR2_9GAMM|nr:PEP-CTERM sorting domain-containing protein [Thalassomonas haliotis]WDE13035.1 PEP-CTERM sorting domain-containing protein [Thalassomonas haliotis]
MKLKLSHLITIGALSLAPALANASVITLDFEGVGNQAAINDFYNGGTDSQGNSGVNYGVSFGSDALGCIDSDAGGSCAFANEPTADTVMFFLSGSSVLSYDAGFDTGFSFFYTSARDVSVNVYSGVNLTGDLLGSINLSNNASDNACSGDPTGNFCNWDIGSLSFAGIARSIDFGGAANYVGFDNITFGSTNPDTEVPEPSSLAILALGVLGLASRRLKSA